MQQHADELPQRKRNPTSKLLQPLSRVG